jgi:hypothetical protein
MNRTSSLGVAVLAAYVSSGLATAVAGPSTDDRGFVDSTARCAAPATAAVFGSTASSRVAVCKDPAGHYEYRGVRISDGAKLIVAAKAADGGFVAENDGITYTVTSTALVVKAGGQVIRNEPMVDFHGQVQGPAVAPAPATQPSAAPETVTPSTPLPAPLPAEVGGG